MGSSRRFYTWNCDWIISSQKDAQYYMGCRNKQSRYANGQAWNNYTGSVPDFLYQPPMDI
jgi:anaerobic ribonucleoside-triphosphate reductase